MNNVTSYKSMNISENTYDIFGHMMNEEIGEILFYDNVLLVEGDSEKYFYNSLFYYEKKFRDFCIKNKFGIFNVFGVDFNPVKKFLTNLGINVYIKTDNDIFKVPYKPLKRYSGIERVLGCLDSDSEKQLCEVLGVEKLTSEVFRFPQEHENKKIIEDNMEEIQKILEKNRVYMSIGHDGFEEDFLKFVSNDISEDDMVYLKKAKMKNLHKYVMEHKIKFNINENNKNSILVRFMYEKY